MEGRREVSRGEEEEEKEKRTISKPEFVESIKILNNDNYLKIKLFKKSSS